MTHARRFACWMGGWNPVVRRCVWDIAPAGGASKSDVAVGIWYGGHGKSGSGGGGEACLKYEWGGFRLEMGE